MFLPSEFLKYFSRAENGVGCSIIEATDNPNRCNLTWIVNTDLKIWIPDSLLVKEIPAMMEKYINDLRAHVSKKNFQN